MGTLVWLLLVAACADEVPTIGHCAVTLDAAPMRGSAEAWVTLVEFADFQCPFCRTAAPTMDQILAAYPDDVRHVFKHLPLSYHSRAMEAALAATCAHAQGRFWTMHDLLFANPEELDDADLERYATEAGLEISTWTSCLEAPATRKLVDSDADEAEHAGVGGTPTFFVNQQAIRGAEPYAEFAEAIDAEITAAEASGVARGDYYPQVVRADCAPTAP